MQRNILRSFVRLLLRWLTRLDVAGLENVPGEGGCILAVNHLSLIDAPLVFALVEREDLTALVADNYRKNLLIRWLVDRVNGIWINRDAADFQALRAARSFLQSGGALGVAPEGTRSRTGGLLPGKTGIAYLADKARVPVIPVGISGSERTVRELIRLRRPALCVRFGQPFLPPPVERQDRGASLQRNTDLIMCRIAELLPVSYRGEYSDHTCFSSQVSLDRREFLQIIRLTTEQKSNDGGK